MNVELPNFSHSLWSQFCVLCQKDSKDPTETVEAWVKRAVRQAERNGSIMPRFEVITSKDNVVNLRGN